MRLNRRYFLVSAGACLLPWLGCSEEADDGLAGVTDTAGGDVDDPYADPVYDVTVLQEDPSYTPLPVQIGAPRATRVMLSTFIIVGHQEAWAVWKPGALSSEVKYLNATVSSGYVKNLVAALVPATEYHAALLVGEGRLAGQGDSTPIGPPTARSMVSRFKTPPADDARPTVRFGLTTSTTSGDLASLTGLAATPWDAFLHLGGLCDGSEGGDLAAARARWQAQLSQKPMFDLFVAGAGIVVPSRIDLMGEAGKAAFLEAVATRPDPTTGVLWASYRWGTTVEVFVTDTTTERSKEGVPQLMSPAQRDWLSAGLAASPCTFKLVLSALPMATLDGALAKDGTWSVFAEERDAVLDAIIGKIAGVVFLTGGLGFGSVHRLEAEGARAALYEIAVPPAGGPANSAVTDAPRGGQSAQFDLASPSLGSAVLTLDPDAKALTLERLAPDGSRVGAALVVPTSEIQPS